MNRILSVLLLLTALTGNAQESPIKRNSITTDAAGILSNLFNQDQNATPFQFMYRRFTRADNALRIGTAFRFVSDEDQQGDDLVTTSSGMFDLRLGYEKRSALGQKWVLAFGADALFESSKTLFSEQTGDNTYEDETASTGIGAAIVLGIHFQLSDRVSIGTEAYAEMVRTDIQNNIRSTFEDTAESSSQDISTRFVGVLPHTLLIGIRF